MKQKNHLHFGLIGALILVVLALVQYFANISSQNALFRWLPTAVTVVTIIWGCINYSKINDADVTFGDVFGNGFRITAILTLISMGFMVIFLYVFPDFKERLIEEAMQAAPKTGSQEDMEKGMEMMQKNFMLFMVAGGIFMSLLTGVIISLIGAAIAKKKK